MDGYMHIWMIDGWMHVCMDAWIDKWMHGWTDTMKKIVLKYLNQKKYKTIT